MGQCSISQILLSGQCGKKKKIGSHLSKSVTYLWVVPWRSLIVCNNPLFVFVCQTMRLESICLVTAADNQLSAMFSDLIAPPGCSVLNNTGPHYFYLHCVCWSVTFNCESIWAVVHSKVYLYYILPHITNGLKETKKTGELKALQHRSLSLMNINIPLT